MDGVALTQRAGALQAAAARAHLVMVEDQLASELLLMCSVLEASAIS
jgi:hypothetical protein